MPAEIFVTDLVSDWRSMARSRIPLFKIAPVLATALTLQACVADDRATLSVADALDPETTTSSLMPAGTRQGNVAYGKCKKNFVATKDDVLVADRIAPGDTHYIEFRVRPSPAVPSGHLYVVHGRLDDKAKPKTFEYIGLFPKGSVVGLYTGIVLPVGIKGNLQPSALDCNVKPTGAFRVSLTKTQYSNLKEKIAEHRENPPDWRMLSYNCNHFAASLGEAVGLKAPRGVRSRQFLSTLYFRQFVRANGGNPGDLHKVQKDDTHET